MNIVPNNVFFTEQEFIVTLAALNNVIRDNRGMSSDVIDTVIGARNEVQYAYAQYLGECY
jgi:hypothetical protein